MENKRDSPSSSSPPSSIKSITSELKEKNNKFSGKPKSPLYSPPPIIKSQTKNKLMGIIVTNWKVLYKSMLFA